jgi:polysaccharide export outer membrane protein
VIVVLSLVTFVAIGTWSDLAGEPLHGNAQQSGEPQQEPSQPTPSAPPPAQPPPSQPPPSEPSPPQPSWPQPSQPAPSPLPGEGEPSQPPVGPAQQGLVGSTPSLPVGYTIGASDVLAITVWDQADLGGRFVVDGDGTFMFPYIGRVKAGGLRLQELEAELKRRLKDGYFTDPQLTVVVEQYQSQRLYIVGEVRNPGTYPLTGNMTLIEAVARAGSTLPTASYEALVVRNPNGKKAEGPTLPEEAGGAHVVRVNLKALQSGARDENVQLRNGDTIFVPRAEMVYVFGQVNAPGSYPISKDTTVLQALSLAGGVTDRGSTGRIKIMRIVDGKETKIDVELTDVVQAGDTIMVPQRFF